MEKNHHLDAMARPVKTLQQLALRQTIDTCIDKYWGIDERSWYAHVGLMLDLEDSFKDEPISVFLQKAENRNADFWLMVKKNLESEHLTDCIMERLENRKTPKPFQMYYFNSMRNKRKNSNVTPYPVVKVRCNHKELSREMRN